MISRFNTLISRRIILILLLLGFPQNADAQDFARGTSLSSETIAISAMQVAQQMNKTGRCYEGVCKALRPLGVELHGEAAYQANDLLMQDRRFTPLIVNDVVQLRRGDIIVYNKSQSHPYGHIAVYQGNSTEASDHVSEVTHTKNYGGATVFRLSSEVDNLYIANASQEWNRLAPVRSLNSAMVSPVVAPNYSPLIYKVVNQKKNYFTNASTKSLVVHVRKKLVHRLLDYILH